MPLQKYKFKPGIDRENTRYTNEGGWWDMQWIRFRSGSPEKMGGWQRATVDPFLGICRKLFNWVDLDNDNIMAMGTSVKLYGERGQSVFDMTPIVNSITGALTVNCIATTSGSTTVTVTFPNHGINIGDYFIITGVGAGGIGGIPAGQLNGEHTATTIPSTSTFTFEVATAASSTTTGSCTDIEILLPLGQEYAAGGTGWGAGPWQAMVPTGATSTTTASVSNTDTTIDADTTGFTASGYILVESELVSYSGVTGTAFTGCTRAVGQSAPTAASTPQHDPGAPVTQVIYMVDPNGWGVGVDTSAVSLNQIRLWSFDNFGENLLANPRGGEIFYWEPSNGYSSQNRAYKISDMVGASNTPLSCNVVLSTDERHVLAFGTNPLGSATQDPLLVRWSDQEDPANWTPTATNSAGDLRVPLGSYIVGAGQARQEILIWTDSSLHSMQYIGAPYIFNMTTLSDNTSLISPNAMITVNNVTYWMGEDKFYAYSGRVETLPCSLRRFIYSDLNMAQAFQTHVGLNEQYGEIMWFYCTANSDVIDRYVVYNYLENIWYYGSINRTAWLDSHTRGAPFATASDGYMYQHEFQCDDGSTNPPSAIPAWIESADFDIDDGDHFSFIKRIIPDITFQNSTTNLPSVLYTLKARNFPGSSIDQSNSRTVEKTTTSIVDLYTNQLWVRIRGRQAVIRVESADIGVMWQLGSTRFDIRPDGRR